MKTYLASKARAQIPAAKGAEADVPVWVVVQPWCKSVVTWNNGQWNITEIAYSSLLSWKFASFFKKIY